MKRINSLWKKIKTDEYILNDKAIDMTLKKKKKITELDNLVLFDKRYG